MTKWAIKAENQVTKLTQEVCLLQAQVSNFKCKNKALHSGQGASLVVVKQNTDVALENLQVVVNFIHTFIKQLVSRSKILNLIAEILKSINRILKLKIRRRALENYPAALSLHFRTLAHPGFI
ncbi:Serologically defined colon cancer antigen 3 like protein [Tupaia chinensis]|uniref:Endosome-associated-trafficking regulator 1 n=1 Tax=Tupaia chinensis TaxID=246437 RepID=L8Y7H4_TUPCH|nr:Serologically defined colon cancer antigen 3 like protein [Tupaia chinensis]